MLLVGKDIEMSGYNFGQNGPFWKGMSLVNNNNYAGWWGKNVWYVDDDNGDDSYKGSSPTRALKTIQKAIDKAGKHDTIFLKPREITIGTYSSHGYFSGTNVIAADQTGLAIIGTGRGGRGIGMSIQTMIEADAGADEAAITVQSPGVTIENLGVKATSDSYGAIYANSNTAQAYGLTISNCFFKDFKTTGVAVGTINLHTIHWTTIQGCTFREAGTAIAHHSTYAAVETPVIKDCDFIGAASTWDADIRVGDVKRLMIDDCRFSHAIPTGGAQAHYINMVGTAGTGMISNCTFSVASEDISAMCTLAGTVLMSSCYGSKEVVDG